MALSREQAKAHVETWAAKLRSPFYLHREKWPSRLFHHSPLENAVQILTDGVLRSRNDPGNKRARDVAAGDVLGNRQHAYETCRFYFRPKTPTQYHIEGIRKSGECKFGNNTHAPVLYMFVFEAIPILTRSGTLFCDRNMQMSDASPSGELSYFESIPFEKVYHEGYLNGDASIIHHRCAEVLATSPLPLSEALQWVYCRSEAERQTLIHKLGKESETWKSKFIVSDDLKVFQRDFTFVEHVAIAAGGVTFRCNPRSDKQKISVRVSVWDAKDSQVIDFKNDAMAATPDYPNRFWLIESKLKNGSYLVRIELDSQLAFEGVLSIGATLF